MSAVPLGPGIDAWRTCRFLGSLLKAQGSLPGGLDRFFFVVLVRTIAASGTLGWRTAGMESRPRPGKLHQLILDEVLLTYPALSGVALLAGILPLRYCAAGFATKGPSWKLPSRGHVAKLITPEFRNDGVLGGKGEDIVLEELEESGRESD